MQAASLPGLQHGIVCELQSCADAVQRATATLPPALLPLQTVRTARHGLADRRQRLSHRHSATCLLAGARRGEGGAAEVVLTHALLQRLQLLAALDSTCRKHQTLLSTLPQSMQGQALNCFAPKQSPLLVLPHRAGCLATRICLLQGAVSAARC